MKFNFINGEIYIEAIERIKSILQFEISKDGFEIEIIKSYKSSVEFENNKGRIYFKEKYQIFRNIGILIENLKTKDEFSITEDINFDTLGLMIDVAHSGALKVETVKKYIDYLAVMGYNMLMLYVEDAFKIENNNHFGYLNGAYTKEELKEYDDYAYEYGIEMIPCIECYGHMGGYLIWPEASDVKDTPTVLLAENEYI